MSGCNKYCKNVEKWTKIVPTMHFVIGALLQYQLHDKTMDVSLDPLNLVINYGGSHYSSSGGKTTTKRVYPKYFLTRQSIINASGFAK